MEDIRQTAVGHLIRRLLQEVITWNKNMTYSKKKTMDRLFQPSPLPRLTWFVYHLSGPHIGLHVTRVIWVSRSSCSRQAPRLIKQVGQLCGTTAAGLTREEQDAIQKL